MATRPFRFGRGQGLTLRGNTKSQDGYLALENVDLEVENIVRKRPGHTSLALLDARDDVIEDPIECWFREEELCISDGKDLFVRRYCEFPDRFDRRGPWTRTRLRVETIFDAGRQELIQAGAARVRDADGVCDVTATEAFGDPTGFVRFDTLADTGERWQLTPTTFAAGGDPIVFTMADNRAGLCWLDGVTLRYYVWTKGTSLTGSPRTVATLTVADLYDGDGGAYSAGDFAAFVYVDVEGVQLQIHWYGTGAPVDIQDLVSTGVIVKVEAVAIHTVGDTSLAGARVAIAVSGQDVAGDAYSRVLIRTYSADTGTLISETLAEDRLVTTDDNTVLANAVGFYGAALDPALTSAEVRTEVLEDGSDLPYVYIDRLDPSAPGGYTTTYFGTSIYSALELCRDELTGVLSVVEKGDIMATTPAGMHDQRRRRRSGFHLLSWRQYGAPGLLFAIVTTVGEVVGRFAAQDGELYDSFRSTNIRVNRRVQRLSANQLDLVTGFAREGDEDTTRTLAQVIAWDTTPRPNAPALLGGVAVSAMGGYPRMYDGTGTGTDSKGTQEHDWHVIPVVLGAAPSAGLGGLSAGTYGLALTWEWSDSKGQLYRSAPDFSTGIVVNANDRILINWRPLFHSERRNVRAVWWRTVANGSIYYRDEVEDAQQSQELGITHIGENADDVISGRERLDQVLGGTRISVPAPLTDFVAVAGGRLWGPDPWRGNVLRYTIPEALGRAPHWTTVQVTGTPTSERVTALAELDGRVIVFTRRTISYTGGDGPDERGRGPSYPVLALLAARTGSLIHEGVVEIPEGLVFATTSGPALLTRGLGTVELASAIERVYDIDGDSVRAVVFDGDRAQVRVANDSVVSESGRQLRFHVGTMRWAQDTGIDAVDMAVSAAGQVVFATRSGDLFQQAAGVWTDGGAAYDMRLSTPHMHEPSSQGLIHGGFTVHGITVFGERRDAHGLDFAVYFDYQASALHSPTVSAATITSREASGLPYVYRAEWPGQACAAARFELSDGSAATEGAIWEGLDATYEPDNSTTEYNWDPGAIARD